MVKLFEVVPWGKNPPNTILYNFFLLSGIMIVVGGVGKYILDLLGIHDHLVLGVGLTAFFSMLLGMYFGRCYQLGKTEEK